MTDTEYKARLLSGNGGAFLFFGDEDYLRRHWLAQTRKTHIPEGNRYSLYNPPCNRSRQAQNASRSWEY